MFIESFIGAGASEGMEILELYDTHGGFQGDRELYLVAKLKEESIDSPEWSEMPLSGEVLSVLDKIQTEGTTRTYQIPLEKVGVYYYFEDHHPDLTTPIGDRSSYNFIFSLFDPSESTLYFLKLDT
jgi:hypothetical protein